MNKTMKITYCCVFCQDLEKSPENTKNIYVVRSRRYIPSLIDMLYSADQSGLAPSKHYERWIHQIPPNNYERWLCLRLR